MKEIAYIRRRHSEVRIPVAATSGSAGIDLCASLQHSYYLFPKQNYRFPTDLFIEIPSGYEGQIRPRSGLASKHHILIPNSPGTIDADYRGEIQVILTNIGDAIQIIYPQERIAQLIITPLADIAWQYRDQLSATQRDSGGFGSTGR